MVPAKEKVAGSGIKIAEVNVFYKHSSFYERIRLNNLCIMSNVNVFATQDRRRGATDFMVSNVTQHDVKFNQTENEWTRVHFRRISLPEKQCNQYCRTHCKQVGRNEFCSQ